MKEIYFLFALLFCVFNLCDCLRFSLKIFEKPKCSADRECIKYDECNEIVGKSFSNQIEKLEIYNLRCGFQDNKYLLICCPKSTIQPDKTDESNESNESNEEVTISDDDYVYNEDELACKKPIVNPRNYPWLALLSYKNERTFTNAVMCNGALINKNYILTTADCLKIPGYKLEYIKLNVDNSNDFIRITDSKIASIKIHPDHDDLIFNIALIKLEKHIIYSDLIKPICLCNETINDVNINLIGFSFERYSENNNLKNVEAFNSKQKMSEITKFNIYSNNVKNSAATNRNSCMASNGAALVADETNVKFLIGLKINAFQQCSETIIMDNTKINTYTNIADNYDWIIENAI